MNSPDSSEGNNRAFNHKVFTIFAILSLFVIFGFILVTCFNVLLLIMAGVMIAVYFRGMGLWLSEKTNLRESLSAILVIVLTLLILTALFWLLGGQIQDQLSQLGKKLPAAIDRLKSNLSQYDIGRRIIQYTQKGTEEVKAGQLATTLFGFFKTTFGVLGDLYIILFLGVFFTATPYLYKKGVLSLVPSRGKEKADEILDQIGVTLRNWLIGRIISMFAVFILTTAGLLIIGMPVPLALGFIAGVFNFVPNFGPIIALIPALLIGSMNGGIAIFLIVIIYVGAQVLESNVITPLVQKRLINIAPALIIIGQIVLGLFGGLLGVLLATPIVAMFMVLLSRLYIGKKPEKEGERLHQAKKRLRKG